MTNTRKIGFNGRTILSGIFIVGGAYAAYWLFNAIIGGTCDARCVSDMLGQTIRNAAPVALAAYCGLMCERALAQRRLTILGFAEHHCDPVAEPLVPVAAGLSG